MAAGFRTDVRDRLPLPLARLYRRTHNAKSWVERHANALYLLEASVKLAASAQISVYLAGETRDESVDRRLQGLALPSLGRWVELLREVSKATAGLEPHPFPHLAGVHGLLTEERDDLPATREALDAMGTRVTGVPAFRSKRVRALDLLDRLPSYRNQVLGHGAIRNDAFYAEMADRLLDAAVEWLDRVPAFGGSVLVHADAMHVDAAGGHRVELWDLTGPDAMRSTSADGDPVPPGTELQPGRLYLRRGDDYLSLHPLVVCEPAPPEPAVLFLNRSQMDRKVEYLDYVSGETSSAPHLLEDHRQVLGRVLGTQVTPDALRELQAADPDKGDEEGPSEGTAGARQFGDFELMAQLGAGGMGTVHLARQRSLGRVVALKLLPPGLSADEVSAARFRREVGAMARADHPNVVRVLQSGRTEGTLWFAMELVEGGDLSEVASTLTANESRGALSDDDLARAVATVSDQKREKIGDAEAGSPARALGTTNAPPHLGEGRSYFRRLAEVFRDAARGLQHLHDRGILHRDVKPGNIMLTRDEGRAVVMDLGLARATDNSALTRPDALLGTIQYAAPEQLQQGLLSVDTRADVYGLGATLYELSTGRAPYEGATTEALISQVLRVDPAPPRRVDRSVPVDLDAVIRKAMDRDPDRRYRSMDAIADDLDRFARGEPVLARPPGLGTLFRLWVKRHAAVAALTAASLLIIVAGTVLFLRSLQTQRDVAERERERAEGLQGTAERERDRAVAAEQEGRAHLARNYRWRAESTRSAAESLLFAARAVDVDDTPDTRAALLTALPRQRSPLWTSSSGIAGLIAMAFSPDGERLATGGEHLRVWDVESGALEAAYIYPSEEDSMVVSVAFDAASSTIAAGCIDGRVLLWNAALPEVYPGVLHGHEAGALSMLFLDGGRRVITASQDGSIRTWDPLTLTSLAVWEGHEGAVQQLAASPDGRHIASGGRDGTIRIWERATGEETHRYTGQEEGGITFLAYVSDERVVATHGGGAIVQWDVGASRPARTIPGDGSKLHAAALTPDDAQLVTGHADGSVRRTDLATGQLSMRTLGHAQMTTAVAVSPDGRLAATGSIADQRLLFWDLTTGQRVAWLEGHSEEIYDIACVSDRRVATASKDATVRLWDAESGREVGVSKRFDQSVYTLVAHPKEPVLAAGFADGTLRLLDAQSLEETRRLGKLDAEPSRAAFTSDGAELASVSSDGHLTVWQVEEGTRRLDIAAGDGFLYGVALTPDDSIIATGGADKLIRLWDRTTGEELRRLPGHTSDVMSLAFSVDGRRLFSVGGDKTLRVWDVASGEAVAVVDDRDMTLLDVAVSRDGTRVAVASWSGVVTIYDAVSLSRIARLEGHARRVWSLAFDAKSHRLYSGGADLKLAAWSFDPAQAPTVLTAPPHDVREVVADRTGTRLASAGVDPVIRVWDAASGVLRATLPGHQVSVAGLAWQHHGDQLISVGADETVRRWNPQTGALEATLAWKGPDYPWDAALSPDDSTLAVACDSGVRLWDMARGEALAHWLTPPAPATGAAAEPSPRSDTVAVAFTPDGRQVVTGTWDGWILVWGRQSGRVERSWRADEDAVFAIACSPDGTQLATTGRDPTVKLWSLETGEAIGSLAGHTRPCTAVAWAHDGAALFTSSTDHTVRIWDAARQEERVRFSAGLNEIVKLTSDVTGSRLAGAASFGELYLWSLEGLRWPAGECEARAEARSGFRLELPFDVVPPVVDRMIRVR